MRVRLHPPASPGIACRRAVLCACLATALLLPGLAGADGRARRAEPVVAIDWPFAETLIALGVTPAGVADAAAYREWVVEPPLPPETVDVGRRGAPHLATLQALAPDVVLVSPFRRAPGLERVAPVRELPLHAAGEGALDGVIDIARELAARYGREAELRELLARLERALQRLQVATEALGGPIYVAQFMDAGHLRVFGDGGLYGGVLTRAGIANAWQGPTNSWGYALAPLARLDAEAARLVLVEPVPAAAETVMRESRVWSSLPVVAAGGVRRLPPTWSFGGVYAAIRFAEQLGAALASGG